MTSSASINLFLLFVFFVLEAGVCAVVGEMAGRAFGRISFWRAKVPELAFLSGYAAFSLTGYAALPFTISAKGIFPAVAVVAVGMWGYSRVCSATVPEWMNPYLDFRKTRGFLIAAAGFLVLCALVTGYRMPWLVHLTTAGKIVSGTAVWDDSRTIGIPIALATYGFPLRDPLAVAVQLAYPLGAFQYTAGLLAWIPWMPLPLLLADTGAQSAFYSITVLLLAGVLLRSRKARAILLLAATVSVSFSLWYFDLRKAGPWVDTFFGYYRLNGLTSTIGWSPLLGLVWIPNHAIGFSALLLAGFWLANEQNPRYWSMPLLFAAFAAATSVDMTSMGLAATGVILLIQFARTGRSVLQSPQIRIAVLIAATAFALLVTINLPTLGGQVDSPYDPLFPWMHHAYYNIGILACHIGPYLLLLGVGGVLLRGWGIPIPWLAVMATGLAFAILFEFHSIWFWRFSFAAHLVLGLAAAWQYERLQVKQQRWMLAVWMLVMVPGLVELSVEFWAGGRYAAWTTPNRASAMRWISEETPLWARVVEYRPKEASLASDPSLLRNGNRGGDRVFDRSYPLIGYQDYLGKMKDITGALASNDYVMVPQEAAPLQKVLKQCAPPRFANVEIAVFEITADCRDRLLQPGLYQETQKAQRRFHVVSLLAAGKSPDELTIQELAEFVSLHPDQAIRLRQRVEQLWAKGQHAEALQALETVLADQPNIPEINYSYAFTLQISGKDPRRAVEYYTRALTNGYDEFWVRYNRGAALLQIHEPARARVDLDVARKLNPKHAGVIELLAKLPGK